MMGCRYGAKNTLDQNYLYLAEKRGAQVFAETKVVDVRPLRRSVRTAARDMRCPRSHPRSYTERTPLSPAAA
jgi:hypothetical protein